MCKLNNKKGFTLVEVLCTIVIMSVLINSALIMIVNCLRLHIENRKRQEYLNFMNALSKEIELNYNYEDFIALNGSKTLYIDEKNLNTEVLKHNFQEEMFTRSLPLKQPYVEIYIINGDILTLNINLYYKAFGKQQNMKIICYKGRFR